MAAYLSRSLEQDFRAIEEVWGLMQLEISPFTVADLMKKHRDRLTDPNTVIAAVNTLEREGKIRVERSTGHKDHRDSIKIFILG